MRTCKRVPHAGHRLNSFPVFISVELLLKLNGISDYASQGRNEARQLVRAFSKAEELILMGDFNVGPVIPPNITNPQPG